MTNQVDYTYFVGDRSIPNINKDLVGFNAYITKYQKEILIRLLGYDLYLAFETGLTEDTVPAKWTALQNGSNYQVNGINKQNPGIKDIIAYYVYCKWLSVNYEQITGVGVIDANAESAIKLSPENKITAAWNNMLNYYYMVYDFILENESDYPNWECETLRLLTYGF